jgi:hypothetical protein
MDHILQHLPYRKGIVYISIGSFLKKTASLEKIHFQQAPTSLLTSGKAAVMILVDPMFVQQDPIYLDTISEYTVREHGTQVVNPAHPKVIFMKCAEFLQEGSPNLKKLVKLIQQNPLIEFYIGDFTITGPCQPFNEYPELYKKLLCMPNVWLSQSCTKEKFTNASLLCPIT